LFLADATGAAAENANTGFISGSAKSYWTASSTFWQFRDSSQNGVGGISDSVDGDLVEKGGAAQRLRVAYPNSQTTRNVYTCYDGAGSLCASTSYDLTLSGNAFNSTNIREIDVGAFPSVSVTNMTSSADGTARRARSCVPPRPIRAAAAPRPAPRR
jgi:type IV pilus assembly protein PilY1